MVAMYLGVAFRAFFAALFNRERAEAIRSVLDSDSRAARQLVDSSQAREESKPTADNKPAAVSQAPPAKPAAGRPKLSSARSDAITLLATLQREARLVDLIQEPLDQFSDAQVGAAARPCLAQCRSTLKRIFDLYPLVDGPEGQSVEVPEGGSPLRYQWVGEASSQQRSGKLVHGGWKASRCELAQWTGDAQDADIIAPVQLER